MALLLWFSSVCSWIIWGIALNDINSVVYANATDQWSLQIGVILSWLAFGILPILREHLFTINPQKWPFPNFNAIEQKVSLQAAELLKRHIQLLSLSAPLLALFFTRYTWDLTHVNAGWINLAVGVFYLATFILNRKNSSIKNLLMTQAITGIVIITWAILLLLEGDSQFLVLSLEAWAIFMIASKTADSKLETLSRIFLFIMGIVLLTRVFGDNATGPFIINSAALIDLLFILLLGHVSLKIRENDRSILYFALAHFGLMGWFLRELQNFENGQGFVTLFWGILALVILIFGFKMEKIQWRYLGSFTIFIVVGKLFLVDLVELETIWRILLFIGFGSLLLLVSYYLTKILKKQTTDQTMS